MATLHNTTEFFQIAYEEFKKDFMPNSPYNTLHNLLWQLIVNEMYKDLDVCFYATKTDDFTSLVLVTRDVPGYWNTFVVFADEIDEIDVAEVIVQKMNLVVFGHTEEAADIIIESSMKEITNTAA